MFKIPFSGNSKVIDLLQVTKCTQAGRHSKTHSKGDYVCYKFERAPSLTAGQTIQKRHCIVQVDGKKDSGFASFWSVKSGFV